MLFVFEGIDGSGKDTIIAGVYEKLIKRGVSVYLTRQPTEKGKKELSDNCNSPIASLLSLASDYQKQVEGELLLKIVNEPKTVILCSRWFPITTWAYRQAQGASVSQISSVMSVIYPIRPDGCFLINCPVDTAIERIVKRGNADKLDMRGKEFLEKVDRFYTSYIEGNYPLKPPLRVVDNLSEPELAINYCFESILRMVK